MNKNIIYGMIAILSVIIITSGYFYFTGNNETGSEIEISENEDEIETLIYEMIDFRPDWGGFTATYYTTAKSQEDITKIIKEIGKKSYNNESIFEMYFFDNEEDARHYLRVSNEESVIYDDKLVANYSLVKGEHELFQLGDVTITPDDPIYEDFE